MASYTSELQYLASPVTTHVQSAKQHNQDVNSLGLISARKTAEAIQILKLMSVTYLVALCQAVDLRHLEENMRAAVKHLVLQTTRKTLTSGEDGSVLPTRFCEKELLQVVDHQPVFSYIDDPSNPSYSLMLQLREILVDTALKCPLEEDDHELGTPLLFRRIPIFQKELKARLDEEVPTARERFHAGDFPILNRIKVCRTYPIYKFVRSQLGTELLSGAKMRSPGGDIEKVYHGICDSEKLFGEVVVKCLDMWRGSAAGLNQHTLSVDRLGGWCGPT